MKKPILLTMVSLLALSACAIVAQAEGSAKKAQKDTCEMMNGCSQHEKKELAAVTQAIQTIDQGRKSNDSKKMHDALDVAYKTLSEMKEETTSNVTTYDHLKAHMDKVEEQSAKVKDEQRKLDSLIHGSGLDVPFIIN